MYHGFYLQNQLEHAFSMLHKQASMLHDHQLRLSAVSGRVFRHSETLELMSEEVVIMQNDNQRLNAKVIILILMTLV